VEELTTGELRFLGLPELREEVCPRGKVTTLEHAIEIVKTAITAHYSERAMLLRPDIAEIVWPFGGHMHAATITPTNGFRWIIPPKTVGGGCRV
jgi:hypothetical protein